MKSFVMAIVLACVIIILSLLYTNNLNNVSSELISWNNVVEELIEEENYVDAVNAVNDIKDYIEKKRIILLSTGNHEDLNKIEVNIVQLLEYLKAEQYADSLAYCSALKTLFEGMPRNYRLTCGNIL